MTKPESPATPDKRGPKTRTDDDHGSVKNPQLHGNRRPDRDLPRGSEGDTRRASGMQR